MNKPSRRTFLASALIAVSGLLGFQVGKTTVDPSTSPSEDSRPLIGIASVNSENYIRAVRDAGGIPVILPNTDGNTDRIADYLDRLDGLLLPGGPDIPPSEYGEEPHETVKILDDARFHFEKALSSAWINQSDKPLLGICLGSQWINVASGGSLVQDIPTTFGVNHRDTTHNVTLESDSRLFGILGSSEFEVNSLHHQAVKDLGNGLRIVARSPEGIVEATETTDPDRFLIGVQWHPEKLLPGDERQAKLLKAFIEAAAARKNH
ncbi:MAG: gamma-glutamyl-gamma-aminobutyrate hydrolase family protein [Verrucomicrobiaceae bacterium]